VISNPAGFSIPEPRVNRCCTACPALLRLDPYNLDDLDSSKIVKQSFVDHNNFE